HAALGLIIVNVQFPTADQPAIRVGGFGNFRRTSICPQRGVKARPLSGLNRRHDQLPRYFAGLALTFSAQSSQQTTTLRSRTFTVLPSSLISPSHTGHFFVLVFIRSFFPLYLMWFQAVAAAILAAVEEGILPSKCDSAPEMTSQPRKNPPGRMPGSTAGGTPAATA